MYKILLVILLIIRCDFIFGQNIQNLSEWMKVLHFSSENTKEVVDQNFYLTNSLSIIDEINKFKKLINSNDGESLACQFPARYLLLKKTYSTKSYELRECKQLKVFLDGFKTKHVSLMVTSEVLNAPASAFGHLLLLFHDEMSPELSSDVIHFSAITNDKEGFFTYAYKGLTGEYEGFYIRNKFFEKYHEYSSVEQRYLFSHKLKISEEQRRMLLYHLFELRKSKFKYYFTNKNCGYRMDTLLAVVYPEDIPRNYIYTLPVETPLKYRNYFVNSSKFPPYSSIAKNNINKLNELDTKSFSDIINGERIIKESDSEELRKAVFYYYVFNFKKNRVELPNYKVNLIQSQINPTSQLNDKIKSPINKPRANKIQFGSGRLNKERFTSLRFRPLLIDSDMFQLNSLHESELAILNTSLIKSEDTVLLDEVDLLSVKVYDSHSKYFSRLSWQGNLSINNKNIFEDRAVNLNVGLGKTYEFFGLYSFFLNLGADSNDNNYKSYVAPEINVFHYSFGQLKFGLNFKKKIYAEESLDIFESKLTYLLNNKYDLLVKYNNYGDFDERTSLNLGYYF
jgi:hypothetical protein